jgi:hypothetical protein
MKILRKIINFINPFHKSIIIHFTNRELIPIHENVKLKHIPSIGGKAFFNDKDDIYYVIDVVHFYKNYSQLIYIVVEKGVM